LGVNPILSQTREWLIQREALRSMAIAARSFDSGSINLAANKPSSPLLTIDKGIGVIAIEGPIVRKPDIFARVLMGRLTPWRLAMRFVKRPSVTTSRRGCRNWPLARSLAPAVVNGNFQHLWLYPAATVLGALLAVPLCKLVRGRLDA
jgi:hypothetical protein